MNIALRLAGVVRKRLSDPIVVMGIVAVMYVVKAILKISIGRMINSPMIAGDGFHNIADLFEAAAVITVILVARRPSCEDYPFGRKNVEFFASLAIGASLLYMSFRFAIDSLVGLLALKPELDQWVRGLVTLPAYEPLVMNIATLPMVLAVTAGSVVLSLVVSRYQIAIGKLSGHASLVADGEETASDGRIEAVTLLGVVAEYLFHCPWLEYPLGLLVAVLIGRTGFGLFRGACRVLLQHSLGQEREGRIREICLSCPGVRSITSLKTFQVGHTAVCMIMLETSRGSAAVQQVKYGVEYLLKKFLLEDDFKECELHIRFHPPEPNRHREAVAIFKTNGRNFVAPTLGEATHLWICDVERGSVVRSTEWAVPPKPEEFLALKRAGKLYVFDVDSQERIKLEASGIEICQSLSYLPTVMGLLS